MDEPRHLLVVGASGVIGTAAVERFAAVPGWTVTAASRRAPVLAEGTRFRHLPLDLTDAAACAAAVATLPPVTHLVYAAVKEAPGLVTGWRDDALIAENGRMFANILDPLAAAGSLDHVIVLQGTKAYGAHHHPVKVPAREDRPRDDHPNFYWLHEDHAKARGAEAGFAVTLFRPQILLGSAPGVAMNPAAAIGAYAALCHATGRPFAFPGAADSLWEMVDAGLLADAFGWAFDSPSARGETYNFTNGDVLVLADAWADLAAALGLADGGSQVVRLADFFSAPETIAAWDDLARRHGLRLDTLPSLLGESHHYADLLLSPRIAAKSVPVLLSTIKIRQAGFSGCRDSLQSLIDNIRAMVALRLLPPFPGVS